ncbi:hypothetical protein [Brevibacterium sp. XM4083]|uniref:hypothetical protein n=1 Tax=Brevibacterium sp. XM4083 TaxID=2583238 RepID=UPI00202F05A9|nr:hypothetical protein [Brevibacterium sp. XM4083]MCM1013591.1 hypothetical protein [Brevibacterium sp. XM4083]
MSPRKPAPRQLSVGAVAHPSSAAKVSPMTMRIAEAVVRIAPGTSSRRRLGWPVSDGTARTARTTMTRMSGMLIANTDRHPQASVSTPPRMDPRTIPVDPAAPQMPRARLRSDPSRKPTVSSARVEGASAAPPSPWMPRPAMSIHSATANVPSREPSAKSVSPVKNIRLRPRASVSLPQSRRNPPKAMA